MFRPSAVRLTAQGHGIPEALAMKLSDGGYSLLVNDRKDGKPGPLSGSLTSRVIETRRREQQEEDQKKQWVQPQQGRKA